ncbi:unnamed protein product [Parnassius apollo]|uniref:(apollo) hypothetical protein n=1 Tax=Parnassius apollo TaxID=110799 RepID=A0A8S3W0C7_PARAO|nr:unnamed protein product [Parnassius apollo]
MKSKCDFIKTTLNLNESYSELDINLENVTETPITNTQHKERTCNSPIFDTPQREKNDECEANNNQHLAESQSTPVPLTVNPIFNKTICYKNINLENTTENPIRNTQHKERTCNSSALEIPQREENDECEANNQPLIESQQHQPRQQ